MVRSSAHPFLLLGVQVGQAESPHRHATRRHNHAKDLYHCLHSSMQSKANHFGA